MHNPRILRKTRRPITAIQLLRRHHLLQHRIIVNRARPDHPDRRLVLRFDPHDAAALLAGVGCHGVARVGGASKSLVGAREDGELQHWCQPDGLWVSLLGGFFPVEMETDLIAHHDGECVAIVAGSLSAPVAMAHSLSRGRWC